MEKLQGTAFTNSDSCKGNTFSIDAPLNMADVTVNGRYPEKGWARNRVSHGIVRVLRGKGELFARDGGKTRVVEGDVVYAPPGEWFVWSGYMRLLIACSPPFNSEQYEIEEDLA